MSKLLSGCAAIFAVDAAGAQRGEVRGGGENLRGASGYIQNLIFRCPRKKALARGEIDIEPPICFLALMLEIRQESNAVRINSGSTAKSLKIQAF